MGATGRDIPCHGRDPCEQEVTTRISVRGGDVLHYEEFLVKHGALPQVECVEYEGVESAEATTGVLEAIRHADLVVIAPSSPLASVVPILDLGGVREVLTETPAPVVAVSPIVNGVPFPDAGELRRARSRAALLGSVDLPATPLSVAELYRDFCQVFVLDRGDICDRHGIQALGMNVEVASTLIGAGDDGGSLVNALLRLRTPRHGPSSADIMTALDRARPTRSRPCPEGWPHLAFVLGHVDVGYAVDVDLVGRLRHANKLPWSPLNTQIPSVKDQLDT